MIQVAIFFVNIKLLTSVVFNCGNDGDKPEHFSILTLSAVENASGLNQKQMQSPVLEITKVMLSVRNRMITPRVNIELLCINALKKARSYSQYT